MHTCSHREDDVVPVQHAYGLTVVIVCFAKTSLSLEVLAHESSVARRRGVNCYQERVATYMYLSQRNLNSYRVSEGQWKKASPCDRRW